MGVIVDLVQGGFVPNRTISDNILLATELIKGYTTKQVNPRCMIKIYLRIRFYWMAFP